MRPSTSARLVRFLVTSGACALVALTACVSDDPTATPIDLCLSYCDEVTAKCTNDNRVYESREQCNKVCALMTQGKEGDNENTVGCRLAHARIGGSKEECRKASAYGGESCGSRCETFCEVVDEQCIKKLDPAAAPYPSKSTCVETCNGFAYDPALGEGPAQPFQGGNDLNCRMFHLLLSFESDADRGLHCPHTGQNSPTCRQR